MFSKKSPKLPTIVAIRSYESRQEGRTNLKRNKYKGGGGHYPFSGHEENTQSNRSRASEYGKWRLSQEGNFLRTLCWDDVGKMSAFEGFRSAKSTAVKEGTGESLGEKGAEMPRGPNHATKLGDIHWPEKGGFGDVGNVFDKEDRTG